jgi:MoaA/NifB/PqqE/SkfB family radical SAM enzyme
MRILVLGNNTSDTDDQVTELAEKASTINQGLIETIDKDFSQHGYYHTTLIDLAPGEIMNIVHKFDEVMVLDQPADSWDSQKTRLSTYKLITTLERQSNSLGIKVYGKDNDNFVDMKYWTDLFKSNRSFCAYPWIVHSQDKTDATKLNLCSRSMNEVTSIKDLGDWQTNPDYTKIRESMKRGEKLPKSCKRCYNYEDRGLTGYRTHDSLDWIARLGLKNIKDFDKITSPYYYELRLSNKCNLMCRMCTPEHSHLLKREFEENPGLVNPSQIASENQSWTDTSVIDVESLTDKHSVYLTGGEPIIMHDVYAFMRKCIELEKTDFHFTMGTNAQRLNPVFLNLAGKFKNLHFSVSIDGFGKINDYVRWKSDFDTIISNCRILINQGHQITWNHVPTIWGIHRTHELFEYLSEHFPKVSLYLQYNRVDITCAFKSPLIEETLRSMEQCKKTILYSSDGKDCTSGIDAFYDHYLRYKINKDDLKKFFTWNDLMDKARNISMVDYIPELDACRNMLEEN